MAKFPEADTRLFKNIFICRKCKSKIRTSNLKVIAKKTACRKCGSKALKSVRKK